jgi:tRNA(Arg) A34 adenosine deaminase TadA
MTETQAMKLAIRVAKQGIRSGQSPFGAVILRDGEVISACHNTVWEDGDPTAHAEVNAIRKAAAELGTIDLTGCVILTTCEPCPMCLSAIHWARIGRVAFGASIDDASEAGFNELHMPASRLAREGGSTLKVVQGPLPEDCRQLFEEWKEHARSLSY